MAIEQEIFGKDGAHLIEALRDAVGSAHGSVRDYSEEIFREALQASPDEAVFLYWRELLGRACVAGSVSMIRHDQWIRGVVSSYHSDSYLGLCGALRGLLESAADSMYSLEPVAPTLVTQWDFLQKLLRRKRGSQMVISEELEERLIHFSYARKADRKEDVPAGHRALQNRDYIDTIRRFDPDIEGLYCQLVEIVHPAHQSVSWTVKHTPNKDHWQVSFGKSTDSSDAICELLDRNRSAITNLLMSAINYSLITLKTLRRLGFTDVDLSYLDRVDLSGIKAWRDIEQQTKS